MAKSMTGYGRAQLQNEKRCLSVEIKSVNSRYFEFSMRLPRNMGFVEEAVKKHISQQVVRGRVEINLLVQTTGEGDTTVQANVPVARAYQKAIAQIAEELQLENDTKISTLLRFSDIFTVVQEEENEEELLQDVLGVTDMALQQYREMCLQEGKKLEEDILSRLGLLQISLESIEKTDAERVRCHRERLHDKLKEVLQDTQIEETRLLQEAAIFADKTAVSEETVRLQSHIVQFKDTLAQQGAIGRKLDFLCQELNREVNTIGSKCQEVETTRLVVDMKGEIEKIREQIQNLE